jgi:hypothetical protein
MDGMQGDLGCFWVFRRKDAVRQLKKPTPEKITKNIVSKYGNFNYLRDV